MATDQHFLNASDARKLTNEARGRSSERRQAAAREYCEGPHVLLRLEAAASAGEYSAFCAVPERLLPDIVEFLRDERQGYSVFTDIRGEPGVGQPTPAADERVIMVCWDTSVVRKETVK